MDREDLALVVVRLAGLYFLVQTLIYGLAAATTVLSLTKLNDISQSSNSDLAEQAGINMARHWANLTIQSATIILFAILAYYFLRKGALVQKMLLFKG